MQLVFNHELILKRASPLFFNGPAASEAISASSLAALASSLSSSWPRAIGAHAALHRLSRRRRPCLALAHDKC